MFSLRTGGSLRVGQSLPCLSAHHAQPNTRISALPLEVHEGNVRPLVGSHSQESSTTADSLLRCLMMLFRGTIYSRGHRGEVGGAGGGGSGVGVGRTTVPSTDDNSRGAIEYGGELPDSTVSEDLYQNASWMLHRCCSYIMNFPTGNPRFARCIIMLPNIGGCV